MLIADDHPVLREGLRALLASQQDFLVLGEAETGQQAIRYYDRYRPDVLLLDLRLPDMSGIDVITNIRESDDCAKIIVLTTYLGDVQALRALKAGAKGYLMKAALRKDLIQAIRDVQAGKLCVPQDVANELALHKCQEQLTEREVQVLRLAASGCSNRAIAQHLAIAEETVKGHIRSILGKLGAQDRTHAVTIALKRGFFEI